MEADDAAISLEAPMLFVPVFALARLVLQLLITTSTSTKQIKSHLIWAYGTEMLITLRVMNTILRSVVIDMVIFARSDPVLGLFGMQKFHRNLVGISQELIQFYKKNIGTEFFPAIQTGP